MRGTTTDPIRTAPLIHIGGPSGEPDSLSTPRRVRTQDKDWLLKQLPVRKGAHLLANIGHTSVEFSTLRLIRSRRAPQIQPEDVQDGNSSLVEDEWWHTYLRDRMSTPLTNLKFRTQASDCPITITYFTVTRALDSRMAY